MAILCFHASHEQFAPSRLLKLAGLAEAAGFGAIHSSDHFHPWSRRQGQSGFSFSWLGAAMQATRLPFSVVCAPGQRYHPAIVAQAISTLAEMFPGRFQIELGSGEAINEMITGDGWPAKKKRNERLLESAAIIRNLLGGKEVSFEGHVRVKNAKLYTLPGKLPEIFCAAVSAETCGWAGTWADGLLTTGGDVGETGKKIEAFQKNGGIGKPISVQLSFSYSSALPEAADGAYDQWRTNLLPADDLANIATTQQFDERGESISRDQVRESIRLFTTITDLLSWVEPFNMPGVSRIILHNVHPEQELFINDFGKHHGAYQ